MNDGEFDLDSGFDAHDALALRCDEHNEPSTIHYQCQYPSSRKHPLSN